MYSVDSFYFVRQVVEATIVAFIDSKSGKLITSPKLICKNYFR
jgi:hypothetical protein